MRSSDAVRVGIGLFLLRRSPPVGAAPARMNLLPGWRDISMPSRATSPAAAGEGWANPASAVTKHINIADSTVRRPHPTVQEASKCLHEFVPCDPAR